jgi:parvulin-like peptidyl-prolyl isomerase
VRSVVVAGSSLLAVVAIARFATARGNDEDTAKTVIVDRVVAIVNNAVILESELRGYLRPMMADVMQIGDERERKRRLDKLASQILDDMVSEELIVQAAEQAKIVVDPNEIEVVIDQIEREHGLSEDGLRDELAREGQTLPYYRTVVVKRQIMRLRAVNELVAPKLRITEDDVRARYDELRRRSEGVEAVRLAHILVKLPPDPTAQQLAAAKTRAAEALARVRAGEDFAIVAKQMSDDKSTSATGGALGWLDRGSLANPEWEAVVFAMRTGDVRGPISGPQGFHVFYVTDVRQGQLRPFAQMRPELERELRQRELDRRTRAWTDELRAKAYVEIKI